MAASRLDINIWIALAQEKGSEFIISVCDTFNYTDYPVYCKDIVDLHKQHKYYERASMQNINEIIHITDTEVIENLSIEEL